MFCSCVMANDKNPFVMDVHVFAVSQRFPFRAMLGGIAGLQKGILQGIPILQPSPRWEAQQMRNFHMYTHTRAHT